MSYNDPGAQLRRVAVNDPSVVHQPAPEDGYRHRNPLPAVAYALQVRVANGPVWLRHAGGGAALRWGAGGAPGRGGGGSDGVRGRSYRGGGPHATQLRVRPQHHSGVPRGRRRPVGRGLHDGAHGQTAARKKYKQPNGTCTRTARRRGGPRATSTSSARRSTTCSQRAGLGRSSRGPARQSNPTRTTRGSRSGGSRRRAWPSGRSAAEAESSRAGKRNPLCCVCRWRHHGLRGHGRATALGQGRGEGAALRAAAAPERHPAQGTGWRRNLRPAAAPEQA
jgi:hypothetical protein